METTASIDLQELTWYLKDTFGQKIDLVNVKNSNFAARRHENINLHHVCVYIYTYVVLLKYSTDLAYNSVKLTFIREWYISDIGSLTKMLERKKILILSRILDVILAKMELN